MKKLGFLFSTFMLLTIICGSALSAQASPKQQVDRLKVISSESEVINLYLANNSYTPTPISPKVSVATHMPAYKWSKVSDAQAYVIQLYQGTTKKFATMVLPSVCGTINCSSKPKWVLPDGNYKWRVKAKVGGVWQIFSSFSKFNIATGFQYKFSLPKSLDRWRASYGSWNLNNGWYRSSGLSPYNNSVYHIGLYPTFSYIVSMRRINDAYTSNRLIVRGTVYPLSSVKYWDDAYFFQYANVSAAEPDKGSFSVFKLINGSFFTIKGWTSTSAINQFGWNKLKVKGKGTSFKFYINNQLVWSGSDPSITTGKVGVGFYKGDSSWQPLLIDSAYLYTFVPVLEEDIDVWAEMGETNTEWDNPNLSSPGP